MTRLTKQTTYAVRFEFPELDEPMFAGMHKGALGWAPSLATALLFTEEDAAFRTLENGYSGEMQRYARVVVVQAGLPVA